MIQEVFRVSAIVTALISFMGLFSGCGPTEVPPGKDESPAMSVAILLGSHANSRDLNLNSPLIRDVVSEAIGSFGFVSVISIDGEPDLIAADNYEISQLYRDGNPQLLKDIAQKKTAKLLSGLTNVRANDPEIDTLEGLRLAARTLASAPSDSEKVIVVVDTGLSTSGFLDFNNNLINAEPATVANLLAEKQAIPDFSGIKVKWQQLGDVSAPQQNLTPAQVAKLEAIWGAIIEKTGGIFECSKTVANPGGVSGDLPPVSIVDLPPEEPIKFDPTAAVNFENPQFLSEDQVRFIGDSANYIDSVAATAVIMPIANFMKADTTFEMLLIGTTAGDENSSFSLTLSKDRANTVKNTLVSLGIPEERILTLGLGSRDPWHIFGVGTSGELATQNRKVVLISADSQEADDILSKHRTP